MQRRTWLAAVAVVLLAVAALGYTRGWWKRGGAKAPATAAAPAPTAPVTAPAADRAQVAPDRAQLARDDDPVGPHASRASCSTPTITDRKSVV